MKKKEEPKVIAIHTDPDGCITQIRDGEIIDLLSFGEARLSFDKKTSLFFVEASEEEYKKIMDEKESLIGRRPPDTMLAELSKRNLEYWTMRDKIDSFESTLLALKDPTIKARVDALGGRAEDVLTVLREEKETLSEKLSQPDFKAPDFIEIEKAVKSLVQKEILQKNMKKDRENGIPGTLFGRGD